MGLIFFAFFEKFFVPILTSGGLAAVSSSAFAALYSAFGKYDVVHIHAEGPAFFAWLPKMFGKRVVVTVHGIDWQREKWQSGLGSKFIHQGEKNAVKYADEVIVLSKGVQDYFKEEKGKSLIPTKDGCNLVCVLPEQITSPKMTAEWENTLMEIERGNADADAFLSGIVRMTGDLVKAYPFLSDAEAQRFGTGKEEIGKCPRCGSPVYVGKGNFYCSNKECSFCLWEDNKFFSSKKKKLTKRIAKELLDKGWCRVTGLYTPKKPQLYDAVIRLDDSGGKYVSFKMEFDR